MVHALPSSGVFLFLLFFQTKESFFRFVNVVLACGFVVRPYLARRLEWVTVSSLG